MPETSSEPKVLRTDPSIGIDLVGMMGGEVFGAAATRALARADVVVGAPRHLAALGPEVRATQVPLAGPLLLALDDVAARVDRGQRVAVLASGDPGFFGLVRLAATRLGSWRLAVHPAPSAVSLAFARLGERWDDARVVSAHGRVLADAVDATLAGGPGRDKVAVLVGPGQPPQLLGRALLERGCSPRRVVVCARLGQRDESVIETDLLGLAAGAWDPLSVVVIRRSSDEALVDETVVDEGRLTRSRGVASLSWVGTAGLGAARSSGDAPGPGASTSVRAGWGRPDEEYRHRAGMITKAEVRAVVLSKLALPAAGVFWDIGAGSGAVSAEVAGMEPALSVFAVERRPDDVARIRENNAGRSVTVIHGTAPAALDGLPDPDRAFVGGGGIAVLDRVLARLRPGGVVVATYAALDRAAAAQARLGELVQISVNRGVALGDTGALRLKAENPVFVCWGSRG